MAIMTRDSKGRFCKKADANNSNNDNDKVYMVGIKGFDHNMQCRGKQYKEGETYTEDKAEICNSGMHFCGEHPLAVFRYYEPSDGNGNINEFHVVEALAPCKTDDNSKFCTTKLKIGAKLSFAGIAKLAVDFVMKRAKNTKKNHSEEDRSVVSSSGDYSVASSSGWRSVVSSSGDYSVVSSSGDYSVASSSGNCSVVSSSGDYSVASSSGDYSVASSSGNYSVAKASGKKSFAINIGRAGKVKGGIGCWIAAAEWDDEEPIDFKSALVDGKNIKADTFYRLKNGKFVEVGDED